MRHQTRVALLAATILFANGVTAQVAVNNPWVRATVESQTVTGAFMQIESPKAVRLVQVTSAAAKTVEIHEMAMENNIMKMRAVPGVDIPANKPVELKPGGYHMMLIDLKAPIKAGDSVGMTLVFETPDKKRETREVKALARPLGAMGAMGATGTTPQK